eukprot:PITA_24910
MSALPAPKGVLQLIRNIQRNFLWGKGEAKKKWALVAWDKICKPRNHGGLGLDDPEILRKALGAKLWWRWLKEPKAQWATIWKEKYANSWPSEDHIRMDGFIIWNTWKENNNKIFKEKKKSPLFLFDRILKHLQETVGYIAQNPPENPPSASEWRILCQLGLQSLIPQSLRQKNLFKEFELDFWQPPPKGFLKFNVDGASKGNPDTAGHGGVLRDDKENILFIFHGHLGKATNNMAEILAMEHCLEFLLQHNQHNVIVEANSDLIINSAKKIIRGTAPEKVSKNWRLILIFQRIHNHLQGLRTITFKHVRRTANKLADLLANQGVNCTEEKFATKWQELTQLSLKAKFHDQVEEDWLLFRSRTMEGSTNNP